MTYLTLIARTDQHSGELGLMIKGVPVIDYFMVANEGFLIAHDILEHQNGLGAIGSIGDELEALGGVWFIRGQHCDMRRDRPAYHSPELDIASDVSNMAGMFWNGVPLRVSYKNTKPHDQDENFQEIINMARSDFYSEYDQTAGVIPEYWEACLHYMRTGYRKAAKRFNNRSMLANSMFWNIADACDSACQHVEYEGQTFRLSYTADDASCFEIIDYDDY